MPSVAPVNESGTANESAEPELRPSDLPDTASLKAVDGCVAMSPDKSPSVPVEGEALVSPQCQGEKIDTFIRRGFHWGLLFLCMHVIFGLVGFMNLWEIQVTPRRN